MAGLIQRNSALLIVLSTFMLIMQGCGQNTSILSGSSVTSIPSQFFSADLSIRDNKLLGTDGNIVYDAVILNSNVQTVSVYTAEYIWDNYYDSEDAKEFIPSMLKINKEDDKSYYLISPSGVHLTLAKNNGLQGYTIHCSDLKWHDMEIYSPDRFFSGECLFEDEKTMHCWPYSKDYCTSMDYGEGFSDSSMRNFIKTIGYDVNDHVIEHSIKTDEVNHLPISTHVLYRQSVGNLPVADGYREHSRFKCKYGDLSLVGYGMYYQGVHGFIGDDVEYIDHIWNLLGNYSIVLDDLLVKPIEECLPEISKSVKSIMSSSLCRFGQVYAVELCYIPVGDIDNPDNGYCTLIPVWKVYCYFYNEDITETDRSASMESFVCFNAVTGEIIG